MLRRLLLYTAVLVAPLVVASCRSDSITDPASAEMRAVVVTAEPVRHPIIFVHGYSLRRATIWNGMVQRFLDAGWSNCPFNNGLTTCPLVAWTYQSGGSNALIADELAIEVDRVLTATGALQVDIVTHSMGGLSSRYYLRNDPRRNHPDGTPKVDAWVSLGGPNHGTLTAIWCNTIQCREMRQGSTFLKELNAGDETPGAVRYATFRSRCDRVVIPETTVSLTGANNVRMAACLSHDALTTDAGVYAQVSAWVHP